MKPQAQGTKGHPVKGKFSSHLCSLVRNIFKSGYVKKRGGGYVKDVNAWSLQNCALAHLTTLLSGRILPRDLKLRFFSRYRGPISSLCQVRGYISPPVYFFSIPLDGVFCGQVFWFYYLGLISFSRHCV